MRACAARLWLGGIGLCLAVSAAQAAVRASFDVKPEQDLNLKTPATSTTNALSEIATRREVAKCVATKM
jgi:hypothetical protein